MMAAIDMDLAASLRAGMRRMGQGVTLVSALDAEGNRRVMTASAVTSVSTAPPSLLVCVNHAASLRPVLAAQLPFCVNVLSRGMEALADLCAGAVDGQRRFALGDWRSAEGSGVPYLWGCEANFFCQPVAMLDHGTHLICVANLEAAVTGPSQPDPLLYVSGSYAGLHHASRPLAERRLQSVAQGQPLSARVRKYLVEQAGKQASMPAVCRALGVSTRSLRRRLKEEGLSFQDLTREVSASVAKQLLQDKSRSIQETASDMGFAHSATFHRAFRRWTGTTPKKFRDQQGT
jgi:flavin reductase (DIM6/NTAB) family NADH-FMN oxidoreductase RutF/transposase-like protein